MQLLQEDFAVILLDVNMPGMDGFETAALVRDREKSRDTPIIFLTAAIKGEAYVARGYSLSAVDYIFKPFEPEILRSKVAVFVQLFRKTEEVRRQAEQLAESALFLSSVLDASTEYAIVAIDLDGRIVAWNEGAHRMHGYDAQQIVGKQHLSVVFPDGEAGAAQLQELLERAYATGKADGVFDLAGRNGERFSGAMVVDLRKDAEGADIGYVAITQDITERLQAERERLHLVEVEAAHAEAKVARGRFAFLAEASSLLTASLDVDLTLAALTRFVIPELADVCVVDLIDADSEAVRRVAVAGAASMSSELAEQLQARLPELIATRDVDQLITLPLQTRGKVKGTLTLLLTDPPRRYVDADLALAADLADRAAIALDNAQLYDDAQRALEQLEQKARLLSEQNEEVERQKQEMDVATAALQQKAEQLALTSKYKSQFLANMSHELRTPLNSMLILSEQLAENDEQQPDSETGRVRHDDPGCGQRPAGVDQRHPRPVQDRVGHDDRRRRRGVVRELEDRHSADVRTSRSSRGVWRLTSSSIPACRGRCTPTRRGCNRCSRTCCRMRSSSPSGAAVGMAVERRDRGLESATTKRSTRPSTVISFAVSDTGIGIPADKQAVIFEAFQQADMTTSRRFGGTGLGLSISREIANLLGGEIGLTSQPGQGSCFTLYLPLRNRRPGRRRAGRDPASRRRARAAAAPPRSTSVPASSRDARPPVVESRPPRTARSRVGSRTGRRRRRPGHYSAR